jgi:hypothetical protein
MSATSCTKEKILEYLVMKLEKIEGEANLKYMGDVERGMFLGDQRRLKKIIKDLDEIL